MLVGLLHPVLVAYMGNAPFRVWGLPACGHGLVAAGVAPGVHL